MVDSTLLREVKKANGDGNRDAKFAFLHQIMAVKEQCSTPDVVRNFDECFRKYPRAAIAVCLAATINARRRQMTRSTVQWADEILACWTNRPHTVDMVVIQDGLHPTRIEEYARSFIRVTTM